MRHSSLIAAAVVVSGAVAAPARAQDQPQQTTQSAATTCEPFGGLETTDVARAQRGTGDGSEITQYRPDGSYIVSHCDRVGLLLRQQEVIGLPSRRGTIRVVAARLHRARGELRWSQALFAVDRQGFVALATLRRGNDETPIPPTARRSLADPMQAMRWALAKDRGCSEDQHRANKLQVPPGGYHYEARVGSMPRKSDDRKRITKGHHAWNKTDNPCGIKDETSVQASYDGDTNRTVHTYADGHNVIDFGDPSVIGCSGSKGTIVVACTQSISNDGKTAIDIDQRYTDREGKHFFAAGSPDDDQVDLWSVASHEAGHSFGLGHADGKSLTMYPTTTMGTTEMRDLGRGDADGLRCRYSPERADC